MSISTMLTGIGMPEIVILALIALSIYIIIKTFSGKVAKKERVESSSKVAAMDKLHESVNSLSTFTHAEKQAISLVIMGVLYTDNSFPERKMTYTNKVEQIIGLRRGEMSSPLNSITEDRASSIEKIKQSFSVLSIMGDTQKAILSMLLVEAIKIDRVTWEKEQWLDFIEQECSLTQATSRAIDNGFNWNLYW